MNKNKIRLLSLLTIRELYLSLRNIWGLFVHPYRTLRAIQVEEDYSQAFLVVLGPFLLWAGLAVLFLLFKLALGHFLIFPEVLAAVFRLAFWLSLAAVSLWCAYLSWWVFYYLRVGKK